MALLTQCIVHNSVAAFFGGAYFTAAWRMNVLCPAEYIAHCAESSINVRLLGTFPTSLGISSSCRGMVLAVHRRKQELYFLAFIGRIDLLLCTVCIQMTLQGQWTIVTYSEFKLLSCMGVQLGLWACRRNVAWRYVRTCCGENTRGTKITAGWRISVTWFFIVCCSRWILGSPNQEEWVTTTQGGSDKFWKWSKWWKFQFIKRYTETFLTVQINCNDIFRWSPLSFLHFYIWPGREVITHCQKLLGLASVRGWLCCFNSDDVRTRLALRASGSPTGKFHCPKMHVGNLASLLTWSFSSRFCHDGLLEKARVVLETIVQASLT
jgi:hypothetical protein